jgi:hypothetical protein
MIIKAKAPPIINPDFDGKYNVNINLKKLLRHLYIPDPQMLTDQSKLYFSLLEMGLL